MEITLVPSNSETFDVLKALVAGARSLSPNLSEVRSQMLGHYMLRAFELGQGQSPEEVLKPVNLTTRPVLVAIGGTHVKDTGIRNEE